MRNIRLQSFRFKERGYTNPSFDRRSATTTGQMLNQVVDSKVTSTTLPYNLSATSPPVANRRRPYISNRISEHDNRNSIQNYGEYFGQGFGKRLLTEPSVYNHDWIFSNEPRPVHPDRSITQRDYRGWPPLEYQQSLSTLTTNRRKSSGHWMASSYDDFGRNIERAPSELIFRGDYKRIPIHPWHY